MRKGFLLTLVGLLVVCCLLYGVIIALPRPRHQAVVDEGLAAAEKAFAAAQADANEASTNGFLNPTFLPYWGRKDKENVPDAPIRQVVENWNAQLYPENDENVDPGKLLKEKNPQFLAALTEFEKVAPELEKAMYAPRFVPPESRITLSTMVMNYIALRSAELGITGLGEVRLAQGRPAEAVSALLAPVVLGSHMLNHGSVLTDQLACATVARGSDAYLCLLDPRAGRSAQGPGLAGHADGDGRGQQQFARRDGGADGHRAGRSVEISGNGRPRETNLQQHDGGSDRFS